MRTFKLFAIIILVCNFAALAAYAERSAAPAQRTKQDYKVLAEGSQSQVDSPFVFVARNEATYRMLQNLVEGLPSAATVDFTKHAVVAGFAGTRPTGGWSVDIRRAGKRTVVQIRGPRKDMMVTQVITTPYRVVLVPVEEFQNLQLDLGASFDAGWKTFRVERGDFQFSGGIAGRRTEFNARGTVRLITFNDLATVVFELQGSGREGKRRLSDIASGAFKNGMIEISRVDPGSFVQLPRPAFKVTGNLQNKRLTLEFESNQTPYADGYIGRGSVTATTAR